jgi:hypothetical protein
VVALAGPHAAWAGLAGQQCLQAATGLTNCTANDVPTALVQLAQDPTVCTLGEDVTVTLKAIIGSGGGNRFDVGLWLNEDGVSAVTGTSCYREILEPVTLNPTDADLTNGFGPFLNADGDSCGDISKTRVDSQRIFTATIKCEDNDGDGVVDTGAVISWDNNTKDACNGVLDAVPGTTAKCKIETALRIGGLLIPGFAFEKTGILDLGTDGVAKPGDLINYTFRVTNTGNVPLTNILVSDPDVPTITCPGGNPISSLAVNASLDCTGSYPITLADINAGFKDNVAKADPDLLDPKSSAFTVPIPQVAAVTIEKATNGEDADTGTGPFIPVGNPVNWTYVVTNTSNVTLVNVTVSDDQGVTVTCPKTTLVAGESMTCTGNGTAVAGQYINLGTVTATPPDQSTVEDSDPSRYFGESGEIDIEKATNGQDADSTPGPFIPVGSPVNWSYLVTNNSNVELTSVKVIDDRGVVVTCPKTTLAAAESMTCTGNGTAVAGQYGNLGTVTAAAPTGSSVTDADPSHYFGQSASIDIEKATNGQDADTPPGPSILVGSPVNWTYVVTNTSNVALTNVTVTDDQLGAVTCPKASLEAGQSMTCTATGTAVAGQYTNLGEVTANTPTGLAVGDSDPSHYTGTEPVPIPTMSALGLGILALMMMWAPMLMRRRR